MRPTVIYILYSGDMYGTEQMAITHLLAVQKDAETVILAPPGPVHDTAAKAGIRSVVAVGRTQLLRATLQIAWACRHVSLLTTSVTQALLGLAVAALCPRTRFRHLNICHGGLEPERSFGNKRRLNLTPARLVAVSGYCAAVLQRFGVPASRILVLENFLSDARIAQAPRRVESAGRLQVLVACRLVPVKRVDLLVAAMATDPRLPALLDTRVLGTGPLLDELHHTSQGMNFRFEGFRNDVPEVMAECDVFVQTWADEPFGLAVVEAMAAGLIVVTPDHGGAAEIVGDESHGLFYRANDAASLAQALLRAVEMPGAARAAMRQAAAARAMTRYSASARRERLLEVFLGDGAPGRPDFTSPATS